MRRLASSWACRQPPCTATTPPRTRDSTRSPIRSWSRWTFRDSRALTGAGADLGPLPPGGTRAHPNTVPIVASGPVHRDLSLRRADAVHGALVGAGRPPRHATMIGASVKYLVVGAAATSFARGFVDDIQVYLDRYPNLVQAHRLREHAEQIDGESFEFALTALVSGLALVYDAVAVGRVQEASPTRGSTTSGR